jgi:hypothetical protein
MHGTFRTMSIMDRTGHSTVTWKPDDPSSVKDAEKKFNEMIDQGYTAFAMDLVSTNGVTVEQKGKRITTFDPTAGKIMMVPQLVGG